MTDSSSELLPVAETLARLLAEVPPPPVREAVPLADALGRTLADAQYASVDVPPADNSAMDGYTGNFASGLLQPGEPLEVSARIAAGQVGPPMKKGTLARIFTGAPLPEGADAVIMQEETREEGDRVILARVPEIGEFVRPRGQDLSVGEMLLSEGTCLAPQDVGLLASVGVTSVPVFRRLKVAVLATGDELANPGDDLAPGQIYNSNSALLLQLLRRMGMEALDLGTAADSREATDRALREAAERADCIISSGGVSVGEEDYVKEAVSALGELRIWRIKMKPGKPLAYGRVGETPFFGLPGNPVSAFVTLLILARPFLLRYQGRSSWEAPVYRFPSAFTFEGGARDEYLRVRVSAAAGADTRVELFANQGSGVLSSVSWANALAVVPAGTLVNVGDPLSVNLFSDLLH